MGLGELYEAEFKNFLGLGENKNDKLKKDIMDAFKEVNYYLDSLSNSSFTPKPTASSSNEAVISEEKVPLNMLNTQQPNVKHSRTILSEKEENRPGKRLKNKRIARQRKK